MKKVILLFAVVASLFGGALTDEQKDTAKYILVQSGYACKKVDIGAVTWDGAVSVYCDDYKHSYRIVDSGGRLEIEVR